MLLESIVLLSGGLIALSLQSRKDSTNEDSFRPKFDYQNEITGDYYRNNSFFEEEIDWAMIGWTVAMMGVCGVIWLVAF